MGGDLLKQLFSQLSATDKATLLENTGLTDVTLLVARIPKDIHLHITNEIKELCKLDNLHIFSTREFKNKMDHGDIDVLYTDTSIDIRQRLVRLFNPLVIKRNGTITTFSYKYSDTEYFQVDFNHVVNLELSQFFFSYGDIGMTIGMIAYHNKLKYGDTGLCLKINGEQINQLSKSTLFNMQEEYTFELSQKPILIANFFGLSYDRWLLGFENMTEAYEWLSRSIFYNPRHFVPNEGKLKRHDKPKRKFMSGFEEYSRIVLESYVDEHKCHDIVNQSLNFFNKFDEVMSIIQLNVEQRQLNNNRASKFTGKNFVDMGLLGKDVGVAINKFQNYVTERFQLEFNTWLDNSNKEHVTETFEHFFHENYVL